MQKTPAREGGRPYNSVRGMRRLARKHQPYNASAASKVTRRVGEK
jgi:hypothetical protein